MTRPQQSLPVPPVSQRAAWAGVVLVLALLCAGVFANSMTKPVSRDEHMYCTGGVLTAQGRLIYRDFSYIAQLPYHPLLLATVYKVFGTTHYLLAGRLTSVACDVLIMVSILAIYRRVFGRYRLEGLLFGLAAMVLYAFNEQVDYVAGYAWNHNVVILCVVLAFRLFITCDFQGRAQAWHLAAMGALLTFATGMRITTAIVELVFLIAILAAAGGPLRTRIRVALPFSLAALVVAIWPVWVCIQAPRAAWLNLVRIPALTGRWLQEAGMAYGKMRVTGACLTAPGYLALLAVAGYLLWVGAGRQSALDGSARRNWLMTLLLSVSFAVIAFIPPTMWEQYWATPVPFLAIALAYPLAQLCRDAELPAAARSLRFASWFIAVAAIVTIAGNPVVLRRLPRAASPARWTPVVLHATSLNVDSRIVQPGPVLTLGPLYALEAGRDIYVALSSSSFVYRIADSLTPPERQIVHVAGPMTLLPLTVRRPPAAVIVGVEPPALSRLESPLLGLTGPDWPSETYPDGLRAYFRP